MDGRRTRDGARGLDPTAEAPRGVICVIGFDSPSASVLGRMLDAGRLAVLAELTRRGRRVELATPASEFAAGAFYSLYSGLELADHGIFYPFQWDAAEQRIRFASELEAPPAVWERLAAAGRRTLAVDPYEGRAPELANGAFVSGVGFTDRVVLPGWSRPADLARETRRRLGRAPDVTEVFGTPTASRLLRLREALLAAPDRVADVASHHLSRERFDLAWLTFSASHLAGHQFWDLSQLDEDRLSPDEREAIGSALEEIYASVDRAIGRVLDLLGPEDSVVICSAVGMEVNTSRADLLPGMLEAVLAGGPIERDESGAIWRLRGALPSGLRAWVADALPDRVALRLAAGLELRGVDWSRTEAFAHPADNQGYVRLNLRGRERDGIVDPADAEALCERIANGLASFRDPGGEPCVESVERTADLHRGLHSDRLPDLVVRWTDSPATRLESVSSESFGEVRRQGGGSGRSGNHTGGDAWAVAVPGSSATLADPSRAPRLVDVAATVCELTGTSRAGLPGEPLLTSRA
ncbi:hypothetical protein HJD18_02395 [Thermoleophilia bacterium SCSIO 60948]|nr:hypothetical protein HJD18_02395 [Thermoleophilia bacterium SCSIO 60948]